MAKFRKYHRFLIIPALIIIAMSLFSGFTDAGEEEIVKSLLVERTNILQDGYFGALSDDDTVRLLAGFETYPLLAEDIMNFRNMQDTDFHRVLRMSFTDISKKTVFMNFTTYEVGIIWDMRSPEGIYKSEGRYHVVIEKAGKDIFLSKFVVL